MCTMTIYHADQLVKLSYYVVFVTIIQAMIVPSIFSTALPSNETVFQVIYNSNGAAAESSPLFVTNVTMQHVKATTSATSSCASWSNSIQQQQLVDHDDETYDNIMIFDGRRNNNNNPSPSSMSEPIGSPFHTLRLLLPPKQITTLCFDDDVESSMSVSFINDPTSDAMASSVEDCYSHGSSYYFDAFLIQPSLMLDPNGTSCSLRSILTNVVKINHRRIVSLDSNNNNTYSSANKARTIILAEEYIDLNEIEVLTQNDHDEITNLLSQIRIVLVPYQNFLQLDDEIMALYDTNKEVMSPYYLDNETSSNDWNLLYTFINNDSNVTRNNSSKLDELNLVSIVIFSLSIVSCIGSCYVYRKLRNRRNATSTTTTDPHKLSTIQAERQRSFDTIPKIPYQHPLFSYTQRKLLLTTMNRRNDAICCDFESSGSTIKKDDGNNKNDDERSKLSNNNTNNQHNTRIQDNNQTQSIHIDVTRSNSSEENYQDDTMGDIRPAILRVTTNNNVVETSPTVAELSNDASLPISYDIEDHVNDNRGDDATFVVSETTATAKRLRSSMLKLSSVPFGSTDSASTFQNHNHENDRMMIDSSLSVSEQHHMDDICPICCDEYIPHEMVMVLPQCHHMYHIPCLQQWFIENQSNLCPLCKMDIIVPDKTSTVLAAAAQELTTTIDFSSDIERP